MTRKAYKENDKSIEFTSDYAKAQYQMEDEIRRNAGSMCRASYLCRRKGEYEISEGVLYCAECFEIYLNEEDSDE